MTVSLQIVGHSAGQDGTRTIPDGATVRATFRDGAIERVDILFPEAPPEPVSARPGDRLDSPLPPGWTLGADGTRLAPRQGA